MNETKTAAALALGAAAVLGGCCDDGSPGREKAERMGKPAVRCEVGAAADYSGVKDPKLEAVYVQTPAEAEKYGPIMREILENGLGGERKLQSGI